MRGAFDVARYYAKEVQTAEGVQRTAGIKARDDISVILEEAGYAPLSVEGPSDRADYNAVLKAAAHGRIARTWSEKLHTLKKGDILLIQFPVIQHSLLQFLPVHAARRRGVRIVLLIHDLDTLRGGKKENKSLPKEMRLFLEEKTLLKEADRIIVHNDRMKAALAEIGVDQRKMRSLGIFDYLAPDGLFAEADRKGPVVIAGTLRRHKAAYAYHLPSGSRFRLYGVGYEGGEQPNVEYKGSFPPDELPGAISGSFGLVWDGDTAATCGGAYGAYLRINNPHKASLYLAAGLPVLIWKEAALAPFMEQHRCGLAIGSLDEIPALLEGLTDDAYEELLAGARRVSAKLRSGYYTRRALR